MKVQEFLTNNENLKKIVLKNENLWHVSRLHDLLILFEIKTFFQNCFSKMCPIDRVLTAKYGASNVNF